MSDDDYQECFGETTDGIWETNGCPCRECAQHEDDVIREDNEMGLISDAQANARYALNDLGRDRA